MRLVRALRFILVADGWAITSFTRGLLALLVAILLIIARLATASSSAASTTAASATLTPIFASGLVVLTSSTVLSRRSLATASSLGSTITPFCGLLGLLLVILAFFICSVIVVVALTLVVVATFATSATTVIVATVLMLSAVLGSLLALGLFLDPALLLFFLLLGGAGTLFATAPAIVFATVVSAAASTALLANLSIGVLLGVSVSACSVALRLVGAVVYLLSLALNLRFSLLLLRLIAVIVSVWLGTLGRGSHGVHTVVGDLPVGLLCFFDRRRLVFRLRRGELRGLVAKFDAAHIIVPASTLLMAPVVVTAFVVLALLPLLGLALSSLFLLLLLASLFFFMIFLCGHICVFFKLFLWQQEVDLHLVVSVGKHSDLIDRNHIVDDLGLVFVADFEENAQFSHVFSAVVDDRIDVHVSGLESVEEAHEFRAFDTTFELGLWRGGEGVNLKDEGSFLLLNHIAKELGVVLIVHAVVRVRVDLALIELVIEWLLVAIASIFPISAIIESATAVATVATSRPSVVVSVTTVVASVAVVTTTVVAEALIIVIVSAAVASVIVAILVPAISIATATAKSAVSALSSIIAVVGRTTASASIVAITTLVPLVSAEIVGLLTITMAICGLLGVFRTRQVLAVSSTIFASRGVLRGFRCVSGIVCSRKRLLGGVVFAEDDVILLVVVVIVAVVVPVG